MFIIYITESQLKSIKSDLLEFCRGKELPSSSHLTEALASTFGFNTNAAMRVGFDGAKTSQCVEFCEARFWQRLSELSGVSVQSLQRTLTTDLHKSVSCAVQIRDMRERVRLSTAFENALEKFFKLMADQGAAYFRVSCGRDPVSLCFGWGGSFRLKSEAMRPAFVPAKPSMFWQWNAGDWNGLIALEFREDNAVKEDDLLDWAGSASDFIERDLCLGDIEFNAEIGLVVHHKEIEGCTKSVLYQRPNQLRDIQAADALKGLGNGNVTLSVIDAQGRSDRVNIRVD